MKSINNKLNIVLKQLLVLFITALVATQVGAVETIVYYHNDVLGSPIAATDQDGNLLWKEDYKPYGERIRKEDGGTNDLWYTSKPHEDSFGLSYFGARWYDPQLGRFTGIDPVGFKEENIHSFNRYAYANNNPYKYIDLDGNESVGVGITFDGDSFSGGMGENGLSLSRGIDHILAAIETADTISDIAMPIKGGAKLLIKKGAKSVLKGTRNPKVAKAAARGQQMHKNYNYGPGFDKEVTLPSGKRADAVNWEAREVIELKPNNPKAIRQGEKQVEGYRRELEAITGEKWTSRVQTYD